MLARHSLSPPDVGLIQAELERDSWTRRAQGKGWSYWDANRNRLNGDQRARCEALAVPPAWDNVWISANPKAHILAHGEDAAGRRQYIYHPEWRAACEEAKFSDMPKFADGLPRLRRRVKQMLTSEDPQTLAVASVVRLLDLGGLRIGHPRADDENPAVGATTLKPEHVEVEADRVRLHYTAKGGKERKLIVDDQALSEALDNLSTLTNGRGEYVFEAENRLCSARLINDFLDDVFGLRFSAKDFRTWGGSVAAARVWRKNDTPTIKALSEAASDWLGNTPTIARNSYIHPAIIEASQSGEPRPDPSGPTRLRVDERFCYGVITA